MRSKLQRNKQFIISINPIMAKYSIKLLETYPADENIVPFKVAAQYDISSALIVVHPVDKEVHPAVVPFVPTISALFVNHKNNSTQYR